MTELTTTAAIAGVDAMGAMRETLIVNTNTTMCCDKKGYSITLPQRIEHIGIQFVPLMPYWLPEVLIMPKRCEYAVCLSDCFD